MCAFSATVLNGITTSWCDVVRQALRAGQRLWVAYVSSGFGNHPLSHLMASMFGSHDCSRLEVSITITTFAKPLSEILCPRMAHMPRKPSTETWSSLSDAECTSHLPLSVSTKSRTRWCMVFEELLTDELSGENCCTHMLHSIHVLGPSHPPGG